MAVFFNVCVCESKREIMGVLMFLERVCVCVQYVCLRGCVYVQYACVCVRLSYMGKVMCKCLVEQSLHPRVSNYQLFPLSSLSLPFFLLSQTILVF